MKFDFTPTEQTILHDPENGKYGNCYPAVLASLFNLDIEGIPHFYDGCNSDSRAGLMKERFFKKNGLVEVSIPLAFTPKELLEWMGRENPELLWVMSAVSPRDKTVNHVVICEGGEFLHDPHPDNSFVQEAREGTTWALIYSLTGGGNGKEAG